MKPSSGKFLALSALICLLASYATYAQVSVLTQHNDNSRTGLNANETVLNTSNVNVASFGKLFSRAVDGYIYAQPLYVSNLNIGGKTRNVVYIATEHNSVYAFDADDPNAADPLWHVGPSTLGTPIPNSDVCSVYPPCPYTDLQPEIGITSTPVIDAATNTIYVVSRMKDSTGTNHFKLWALDLLTGTAKFGSPAEITATTGSVQFDPFQHLQRPGLLLLNGNVYMAFGAVGDFGTWHGWLMAYNSATLTQTAVFNVTPGSNATAGGIWAGGQGLVADGNGFIYLVTGNGTFDANSGGSDYGDSVVKLNTVGGLSVTDYFTPNNQLTLDQSDIDLGSGGPMEIPGTHLLVAVGKDSTIRLLNANNLGQFGANNNDLQEFQSTTVQPACTGGAGLCFMGGPVYYNSPTLGQLIYLWPSGDYLKAFKFNGSTFQTAPISESTNTPVSEPGQANASPLSISANRNLPGTAIVWASVPVSGDAVLQTVTGVLRAFDASDLTHELWNSDQNAARDAVGNYAKFNPPTIANGKVYLGTFSGQLLAYGLNGPPPDFTLSRSPSSATVKAGQAATYTIGVTPANGFNGSVMLSCSGAPPQATCGFSSTTVSAGGTSILTVITAGATAALSAPRQNRMAPLYGMLLPIPGLVLAGLGSSGSRRRKMNILASTALLVVVLLLMMGCGGGSSGGGGGGNPGTPAGTYNITVTAVSGSLSHQTIATLTVQ